MRFVLFALFLIAACSSSDFDAGTPVISKNQPATGNTNPNGTNTGTPGVTNPIIPGPVGKIPDPPSVAPDGTELYNSCNECMARAQQLASIQGFTVSKSRTYNLGQYKVDPSKTNICDIHFMADMSLPIDDHEGRDSVGNGQVMIYCPCNCGWSNAKPSFY